MTQSSHRSPPNQGMEWRDRQLGPANSYPDPKPIKRGSRRAVGMGRRGGCVNQGLFQSPPDEQCNLKVKTFVGTSASGLQIRVWTALIALLVLKYLLRLVLVKPDRASVPTLHQPGSLAVGE